MQSRSDRSIDRHCCITLDYSRYASTKTQHDRSFVIHSKNNQLGLRNTHSIPRQGRVSAVILYVLEMGCFFSSFTSHLEATDMYMEIYRIRETRKSTLRRYHDSRTRNGGQGVLRSNRMENIRLEASLVAASIKSALTNRGSSIFTRPSFFFVDKRTYAS